MYAAPDHYPSVTANRLNVTHMNITWRKLSLEEARGFITSYTVSYDTLDSRRRKEATVEFVHPEGSYKVISGLGITISYVVTVSASTAVGLGINSPPIIVNGKPNHHHTIMVLLYSVLLSMPLLANIIWCKLISFLADEKYSFEQLTLAMIV